MTATLTLTDLPLKRTSSTEQPTVRLRAFRPNRGTDAEAFRVLNEARIRTCFVCEDRDDELLLNSESYIMARGGHIFFAEVNGNPVGCCALIPMQPGVFEVGRLAVAESWRGRGIGRKLLGFVIEQARSLGASSLYFETTGRLAGAVHLYESMGFRRLPDEAAPTARNNVFMEMSLRFTPAT